MSENSPHNAIPHSRILRLILFIRNQKVILDDDLANLYEVETGALIRAVRRNIERFPDDFMFQLNQEEFLSLKHTRLESNKRGGRRYAPYAFTEQGVAMLSSVLHSPNAIHVNVEIMRTFVKIREILATHKELAFKIEQLESKYDSQFKAVFDAIKALMRESAKTRPIGFFRNPGE